MDRFCNDFIIKEKHTVMSIYTAMHRITAVALADYSTPLDNLITYLSSIVTGSKAKNRL